jgi:molybdopterin synthase sulfur carrier subunit
MPKVVVRALGRIRDLVGSREVEIQVKKGCTVRDALRLLAEKRGKVLEDRIFDPDTSELRLHIRVLLNGQNIDLLEEGLETRVEDRDVITVFPPAGGGKVHLSET